MGKRIWMVGLTALAVLSSSSPVFAGDAHGQLSVGYIAYNVDKPFPSLVISDHPVKIDLRMLEDNIVVSPENLGRVLDMTAGYTCLPISEDVWQRPPDGSLSIVPSTDRSGQACYIAVSDRCRYLTQLSGLLRDMYAPDADAYTKDELDNLRVRVGCSGS